MLAKITILKFSLLTTIFFIPQVLAETTNSGSETPIFIKVLLFFSGHYGWGYPILCLLLLSLSSLFLFLGNLKADSAVFRLLPWLGPRSLRGYERNLEVQDEYSRLLSLLGLADSASEEDIKSAYRERVKQFHPDSNELPLGMNEDERVKQFDEIKQIYERIMEMQKGSFGRR